MKKLKKHFLAVVITVCALNLNAQNKYTNYVYDASGNRTKRILTRSIAIDTVAYKILSDSIDMNGTNGTDETDYSLVSVTDNKKETHSIKVYPNPTSGFFEIEFSGLTETSKARLEIYTFSGRLIKRIDKLQNRQSVNIFNEPSGIYLLRIIADDTVTTIKLIKN